MEERTETERRRREGDNERAISIEEVINAVRALKEGKTVGGEGIPNKAWKLGGEGARKRVHEICNEVWKGEGWPKTWRKGII